MKNALAFPCVWKDSDHYNCHEPGMTLRDYFAAKAMQMIMQGSGGDKSSFMSFADRAYKMADAMLQEREK